KFAGNQLAAGNRLGEQRKDSPVLPLGRDLPRGSANGNDQRRNPDQQQADFLQITNDFVVVEKIQRAHQQRDDRRQHKEDVKILPPVKLLDDHGRDRQGVVHRQPPWLFSHALRLGRAALRSRARVSRSTAVALHTNWFIARNCTQLLSETLA